VSFVVEELKAVFDPRGGAWMGGKYIPSILAAIGGVIERHLVAIGFIEGEGMGLKSDPQAEVAGALSCMVVATRRTYVAVGPKDG
jgi:ribonucleoside-diphosphate reductase alpha chain